MLLISYLVQAQKIHIDGIVKNKINNKPICFAVIKTQNSQHVLTDANGKFSIDVDPKIDFLQITFAGFKSTFYSIGDRRTFYTVYLVPKPEANQQARTSDSAASTLIANVILNKNQNDPQIKCNTFQFIRYTRLLVTANPDSIVGKIDSVFVKRGRVTRFKKIDSTDFKFKKIIAQHHLFEAEKVSQFQFNAGLKETVLATKVAGLNEPIYELMGFNLQSFSIYSPVYQLLESKFDNPISKKGISKYNFFSIDSLEIENRKVALIYFRGKSKTKTDDLQGVLYIDLLNFAVAQAECRTSGVLQMAGSHTFHYFDKEQLWFPAKKTFRISKGKNNEDISILGGTIEFKDDIDDGVNKPHKTASDFTYLLAESTNNNIEFNTKLKINRRHIAVDITSDANKKPEEYWNKFRSDSLDYRSRKTYTSLDSLSVLNKVEKRIFFGRKVIKGFVPYYFFDLDLKTLVSFNNYEGFRLGFGGMTNERFSKIFRADGYLAYGLKDETYKYHVGLAARIANYSNTWVGVGYADDLSENASSTFLTDKKVFRIYTSQPVSINTFYSYKSFSVYLETRIIPKTFSVWQISKTLIEPKFEYSYILNGTNTKNFDLTTASVAIQWNPFSDYLQSPRGKLEIEKRYPKFAFQFTQTIPRFFSNDFQFKKFDFRTEWSQKHLNGQKTTLLFMAGYAMGDIPITHLYNTAPNCLLNESLLRRFFSIVTDNSFETMYFNEFFSDKYLFLQGSHSFKRIKFSKNFGTSIAFVQRVAWGNLENRERHVGIPFKTLDQGFYESGLQFNQIYKGLGIGSFYRYGPNGLPGFYDNFAIKASFVLDLGI